MILHRLTKAGAADTMCGEVAYANATTQTRLVTCARCLSAFAQLLARLPDPDEDTITATMRVIGARGGHARAATLTPERRRAIAQTAGKAPKKPRAKVVVP